jgi:hypothetical protein
MPKHHTKQRRRSGSHTKHRRRTMRGGTLCSGTSGCGLVSFGGPETALAKLNHDMFAPSNNSTNLFTGKSACGMTGGKYPKKKRGKKHGGSGLTAIAVPAALVAANQMYSRKGRKGRKGKSMRRRRSMRGGQILYSTAQQMGAGDITGY